MIYVLSILLGTVSFYLFLRLKKIEKKVNEMESSPKLKILETRNGGVSLIYKNQEIYYVKPR